MIRKRRMNFQSYCPQWTVKLKYNVKLKPFKGGYEYCSFTQKRVRSSNLQEYLLN